MKVNSFVVLESAFISFLMKMQISRFFHIVIETLKKCKLSLNGCGLKKCFYGVKNAKLAW